MNRLYRIAVLAIALAVAPSLASAQTWTNWSSFTTGSSGSFNGTLFGSAVTYNGNVAGGQTTSGTDYWNEHSGTAAYTQGGLTAPDNVGFIKLISSGSGTLTFATPVTNLYLALISVGQSSVPITYTFDQAFTVVSNNNTSCAYWGCGSYTTSGTTLTGYEFSGTIEFSGSLTSLSIATNPDENWHGFTVGADMATVPEPSSVALMATGVLGLAGVLRRRRKNVA